MLRDLARRLVTAQESERSALSRELHDELGRSLTAVKINLTEILRDAPDGAGGPLAARIAESNDLIDRMLEQTHEMALDLHPAMMDDLGLIPTLRGYIRRFNLRTGIEVEATFVEPALPMGSDLETNLYRIIQEALTNVSKHARAKTVTIVLGLEDSDVRLSIADDGVGFDLPSRENDPSVNRGLGLLGMQERVSSVGGRIAVESAPGRSTRLDVSIPWKGRLDNSDQGPSGR
jgi:hypothetical protein